METVYSVESEDGNEGAKPVQGAQEKKSDFNVKHEERARELSTAAPGIASH